MKRSFRLQTKFVSSIRGQPQGGLLEISNFMSLSLIIRKTVICWWLAMGSCVLLFAQGSFAPNYAPNGGEYPVAGLLAGTQVHPELAINTNGGFVVWEDNTIDGNGIGIRAAALDSRLSLVPARHQSGNLKTLQ